MSHKSISYDLPFAYFQRSDDVKEAGVGGDKQNFWRNYMGFQSAEAIREAILTKVSPSLLQLQG